MNVLVIENERPAADRIIKMLKKTEKSVNIAGVVETVEEAINRLQMKPEPDLILMDIQLDDGLCFEIFETINIDIPVIFVTAYDEYMLKAFKVNSVDYLLKPVDEGSLKSAIEKFKKLHFNNEDPFKRDFRQLVNEFRNQYKSRFLIKIGEKFRSVPTGEISHFHINERNVFISDFQGRDYGVDYSLEQLQSMLDPRKFFRINRECIVNIDSISLMYSYSSSRLQLTLKDRSKSEKDDLFVVSRDKVAEFKKWIDR
jgi:DNA-binding LytR/AlgR family response regulator